MDPLVVHRGPRHHSLGSTALDSKLTFENHLRNVVHPARSLDTVHRAGKLRNCSRVFQSCFNAYVLYSVVYCAPVWM